MEWNDLRYQSLTWKMSTEHTTNLLAKHNSFREEDIHLRPLYSDKHGWTSIVLILSEQ